MPRENQSHLKLSDSTYYNKVKRHSEYKYYRLNNYKLKVKTLKLMVPLGPSSTTTHVTDHVQNVGILKIGHKITFRCMRQAHMKLE